MIEVQDIVKRYGATVAVNHVSFRVDHGEILGFLGPNGAGKSTTIKILTCYIVADSGRVSVDGSDVLDDSFGVRRKVGYLPESTPLYPDMRVIDYLKFAAKARQIPAAQIAGSIERVVGLLDIERMLRKNVGHLSKGYRQRVGLAQALIHDPPILILDEPTSGLDPHQIIEIRELLRELGKTKVILFSSHILQEISAICSRIIVIKDGRLVADGRPLELQASVTGRQAYRARIAGPEGEVKARLGQIQGVDSVEVLTHHENAGDYRLRAPTGFDLGLEVYNAVQGAGWKLSALEPQMLSLEDVYLKLTSNVPAAPAQARAAG